MTEGSRREVERERPSREEDGKRREDKVRLTKELQEAWRRNHPSEEEQKNGRPGKGGHW
jgi:hypothetical protein